MFPVSQISYQMARCAESKALHQNLVARPYAASQQSQMHHFCILQCLLHVFLFNTFLAHMSQTQIIIFFLDIFFVLRFIFYRYKFANPAILTFFYFRRHIFSIWHALCISMPSEENEKHSRYQLNDKPAGKFLFLCAMN